jgi:hypothetical protein
MLLLTQNIFAKVSQDNTWVDFIQNDIPVGCWYVSLGALQWYNANPNSKTIMGIRSMQDVLNNMVTK